VHTATLRATLFHLLTAAALGAPDAAAAQAPAPDDSVKVVLHVSEGTRQAKLALYMAKRDLDLDPRARVAIVAYGEGMQFLQNDRLFSDEGPKVAALAALEDHAHLERTRTLVLEERGFLSAELVKRGYVFPPSQANFLLVRVPDPAAVRARLLRAGILVRDGASVGFPGHLRFSIGLRTTNEKLLSLL